MLTDLGRGVAPGTQVILYGPRGNGKTALLGWLRREARAAGIETVVLRPSETPDEVGLRSFLLPRTWIQRLAPSEVGIKGLKWKTAEVPPATVAEILAERAEAPLLVLVDEAHTLEIAAGRALLNAAQEVAAESPLLTVLAGTPNLEKRLDAMGASFWNRAEQVRMGRLSPRATEEAFCKPLSAEGIAVPAAASAALVTESQRYPYFIQLLGREVWRLAKEASQGRREVSPAVLEPAKAAFIRTKRAYYAHRWRELATSRGLTVGRAIAEAFRNREALDHAELEAAVRSGLGEVAGPEALEGAIEILRDLGYIWWMPAEPRWEPGIPSLMDYVREFASQASPGAPGTAERP